MSVAVPTRAEQTTGTLSERQGAGPDNYRIVNDTTVARAAVQTDVGALIVFSNAAAVVYTIPDSTVAAGQVFAVGDTLTWVSTGAGGVTVAKTGADTLTGTATAAQFIKRAATKTAATVWTTYV